MINLQFILLAHGLGMARNEVPPNSLYSIFEDRDKDPVRVLNELERGLRSDKVGEQCESILFFAELFSRYPFPSIVASAFVKLADLYHGTRYILHQ